MLQPFSERFTLLALLSTNGLLIAAGVAFLSYGIYTIVTTPKQVNEEMNKGLIDGTVNIVMGVLNVVFGGLGVAGALLKKRLLLMGNALILTLAILTNLGLIISVGVSAAKTSRRSHDGLKNGIIKDFGLENGTESQAFSNHINEFQRKQQCCGWTGINGENVFVKTNWYRSINLKSNSSPVTLPDSCCTKVAPECQTATNVMAARNGGHVHPIDCLDSIMRVFNIFIFVTMTQLVVTTLVQILMVGFAVLTILQGVSTE